MSHLSGPGGKDVHHHQVCILRAKVSPETCPDTQSESQVPSPEGKSGEHIPGGYIVTPNMEAPQEVGGGTGA